MSIEDTFSPTSAGLQKHFVRSIYPILLFISITAAAAETATDEGVLGPKNWPITVEQAVDDILPRLSLSQRLEIKLMKKESIDSLHFDLGLSIRNRYGLWRGNDRLIFSACGFRCHPDDASMKIIEAVRNELQK